MRMQRAPSGSMSRSTSSPPSASAPRSLASPAGMSALARIDDLHVSFGGVAAASGVSFAVERGELLAMIGPNGAGKTTVLRMVAGLLRPDRGRVLFDERDVTGLPAHARVRL